MDNEPVNVGIAYGEAKSIHVDGLYKIQRDIGDIIKYGATNLQKINYDGVKALVELAIASIPDVEQGEKLRELLELKEKEQISYFAKKNNHLTPTVDDEQDGKREASMAIFNLVHVVYDRDIGIRKQLTFGTV